MTLVSAALAVCATKTGAPFARGIFPIPLAAPSRPVKSIDLAPTLLQVLPRLDHQEEQIRSPSPFIMHIHFTF